MKRYKINEGVRVNKKTCKAGIMWRYAGKVEDWQEVIKQWDAHRMSRNVVVGIRITDTETGQVVCEKMDEEA